MAVAPRAVSAETYPLRTSAPICREYTAVSHERWAGAKNAGPAS